MSDSSLWRAGGVSPLFVFLWRAGGVCPLFVFQQGG
jgi:hypothetical protein